MFGDGFERNARVSREEKEKLRLLQNATSLG
jgi:hypothetical protein